MHRSLHRWFLLVVFSGIAAGAQALPSTPEEAAVEATVGLYLHGTSYNQPAEIARAFHPDARLYLDGDGGALRTMGAPDYASLFPERGPARFNGRQGRLLGSEVSGSVATASAEILMPNGGARYIDVFLLKKSAGHWQIVSKSAHREDAPRPARRVLFAVSNADRYPGTQISTGNNFPELAYAYDTFRRAGYAVDFVSIAGGALPLEMIDTADPLIKRYLYDSGFMAALKRSKALAEIKAGDYAAMLYTGGGAAILGVPGSQAMQAVALQIHEQGGGVLGAICQGTEALSQLQLGDGRYLIGEKTLTSFPDAFLNQNSPAFKAHPFSTEGSIRRRGATFRHGANGSSHVEVDGRLVTGMNWESSVATAQAMIRLLASRAIR